LRNRLWDRSKRVDDSEADSWRGIKRADIALCIQIIKMLKNTGEPMDALELAKKQSIKTSSTWLSALLPCCHCFKNVQPI